MLDKIIFINNKSLKLYIFLTNFLIYSYYIENINKI